MFVRAKTGLLVPKLAQPRRYIGEEPVEVPNHEYYRRLIMAGDLVLLAASAAETGVPKPAAESDDEKPVKKGSK